MLFTVDIGNASNISANISYSPDNDDPVLNCVHDAPSNRLGMIDKMKKNKVKSNCMSWVELTIDLSIPCQLQEIKTEPFEVAFCILCISNISTVSLHSDG